jgi:hypothetical protein
MRWSNRSPTGDRADHVNAAAYKTLTGWAARWPRRCFAVEGAAGLGPGIAQLLAAAGQDVEYGMGLDPALLPRTA